MPKKVFFPPDLWEHIYVFFFCNRKKYKNIVALDNKKYGFCLYWVLSGKMDTMNVKAKGKEKWQLKPIKDGGF